jgi:hypothetical protein
VGVGEEGREEGRGLHAPDVCQAGSSGVYVRVACRQFWCVVCAHTREYRVDVLGTVSFFLSLWIYLWLAETSQQPISQTTWLKVTPHCNHCNHC